MLLESTMLAADRIRARGQRAQLGLVIVRATVVSLACAIGLGLAARVPEPLLLLVPAALAAGLGSYWSPCGASMVGVFVPHSGNASVFGRISMAHTIGCAASGAAAGSLISFGARAIIPPLPMVLGLALLFLVAWEILQLPIPYPQSRLQAPRAWSWSRKPARAAFLYGLVLGSNLLTRIGSAGYYAVLASCVLVLIPLQAAILFGIYGAAKSWPLWAFGFVTRATDANLTLARSSHVSPRVRQAMHVFGGGLLLVSAVGVVARGP